VSTSPGFRSLGSIFLGHGPLSSLRKRVILEYNRGNIQEATPPVSEMPEFWRRPFRMVQFNLRAIDARGLDVRRLMAQVIEYGANVLLVNGGGIMAWYPSRLRYHRVNAYMSGDVMGEVVRESHRQGLKVLVRRDVSKGYPELRGGRIEGFRVSPEGEIKREGAVALTCFRGVYWQEHSFGLVDEIMSRYPVDGFFHDHLCFGHCTCRRCREAFRDQTSLELPWYEDWNDPSWRVYVRYRYQEMVNYMRRLHAFIRKRNPRAILTANSVFSSDGPRRGQEAGWLAPWLAQGVDIVTAPLSGELQGSLPRYALWPGEEARMGHALGEDKPVCVMVSYAEGSPPGRAARPPSQLVYDLMQVAAHGAQPCLSLSGTFEQDDRKSLSTIKTVYRYLRDHATSYEGLTSAARVALVYSQTTMDFYGRDNPVGRCLAEYRGFYEALVASHVQFDVLHDASLDAARLSGYDLLVLPNVAAMSDAQGAMLDAYVEAGGHLVASFETGLYDQDGEPREAFALSCLGRALMDRLEATGGYLRIQGKALLAAFEESDLLALRGTFVVTGPLDGPGPQTADLYLIPPVPNSTPEAAYFEGTTDVPGLVLARCGAGEAAYLPWEVGKIYHLHGIHGCRQIVLELVRRWVPPVATTNAPASVEMTLHHPQGDRDRCLVHLLNATGWQGKPLAEVIPVHDVSVWVRGPYVAARELSTGDEIALEREDGGARVLVPRLESFAAIELVAAGVAFVESC